jgi:glycosyltransferase involved in cell wall biosynthesis
MLVNKDGQTDACVYGPEHFLDKVIARACPLLDRLPGRLAKTSTDRISSSWLPDRLFSRVNALQPEILNLHWVNDGFMRIETLPRFQRPIVWTFHDMWPMAGGEHYVGESLRYRQGYSASNRPEHETGLDVNRWIWNRKRKAWFGLTQLVIASPSRWLAGCVRESLLFRDFRVEVLPNGVDHERFSPMDHDVVRSILGLPKDKKLILFGAVFATGDSRKGYHLLVETLTKLETMVNPDEYALVVFGASGGKESFSMKTHYLGNLHDEISMALVYAAADVFLAPSLEDNLPNTVLESLSCGTPVVAFNIGGMPDMVIHEKNGYLARGFDTDQLAQGLRWVLEDAARWRYLSNEGRNTILNDFTLQHAASRYLDLYTELLGVR